VVVVHICDLLSKSQLFSYIPQNPFIASLFSLITKECTAKVSAIYDKLPWRSSAKQLKFNLYSKSNQFSVDSAERFVWEE